MQGLLPISDIQFCNAGKVIFGVEKYRIPLEKVCDRYGVVQNHHHDLIKIDGPNKTATFKVTDAEGKTSEVEKAFDMIHVTPPQGAPDFVKSSPLADENGWIDVDKHTMQHTKYPNVFGLGDATNTPNAKTGAAVRKQAPVVVSNLLALLNDRQMSEKYQGYGSCPLVTGRGKLILAEFDYSGKPTETFPFNQAKERWSMWLLKTMVLPWLYWNKILKGKA
jgi:sulfide:quinone oxidoreductase